VQKIVLSVTDSVEYAQAMKGRHPTWPRFFSGTTSPRRTLPTSSRWVQGDRLSLTCDLKNHRRLGMKPIRTPPTWQSWWGDVLGHWSVR
jgi:hypothetical protein